MKRVIVTILSISLLISFTNSAHADLKYSECLLDASTHQYVSLGKPLTPERLGNKSKVRIGVLPFYFTEGSVKLLSNSEKSDYIQAAERIKELSNQNVSVEIVFFPSVNSGITSTEFKQIYTTRNTGWNEKDLSKSTWGFVKRNILNADKSLDFSNLDGLVLEGANEDFSYRVAEAMIFFRGSQGNNFQDSTLDFFKSVHTNDGYIDNAILLDSHKGIDTIAHELLHNFGLTDLYGGTAGPGPLSLMAAGSRNLLNYEKAVLGWFPTGNIKCSDYREIIDKSKVDNRILLTDIKHDSILLLKISTTEAYVIEIVNDGGKSLLVLYLLEQENRPPITIFSDPRLVYQSIYDVSIPESVGSVYKANDFDLLISDLTGTDVELKAIPKDLSSTNEAVAIFEKSRINRERLISLRSAADKAAADKAAADKAAADKARQQAEVKPVTAAKKTISCIKGKVIKKITAIKPVCPKGYKKK